MKNSQLVKLETLTKKFANDEEFQEYLALFSLWTEYRGTDNKFRMMVQEQTNVIMKESEVKQ